MATNNGWTLANNNADIEIENAAGDIYGFALMTPTLPEAGASQITASTGETTPTFRSAEPFETVEWTDFSYGYGQTNMDRDGGGIAGQGGNASQYFYGDCFSLRPGKLLPGMARDQIYNTVTGQMTPISDGIDPVAGDEYEVPRGVLPDLLITTAGISTPFTTSAAGATVTNVRLLLYFRTVSLFGTAQPANINLNINPQAGGGSLGVYSLTLTAAQITNYTGFKWVTVPLTSGTGVLAASTAYQINVFSNSTDQVSAGCYIGPNDAIRPYFQLMTSATPFKWWANTFARIEQVNDAGTYINAALTLVSYFNTAATSLAGSVVTSPERNFGNPYLGSVIFKKNLYVSTTTATAAYSPHDVAINTTPNVNAFDTNITLFAPVVAGGLILASDVNRKKIFKWAGVSPATGGNAPTDIIAAGVIGDANTLITNLVIFQGSLYIFKPEGIFKVISVVGDISTNKVPDTAHVWTPPGGVQLDTTGLWVCEHQGKLYFNWKNLVMELVMQEDKPTITPYNPSPPWFRQSFYNYVNGITSDGQNIYASINNYGIVAFNGFGWHPITEFYEQVNSEGVASGLRWLPNPQGAPDYLYCGDGRTLLKIPIPNAFQPYTSQIFQNHQNKCGYWISPEWTGNLAADEKNLRSVILRAVPNGWSYKMVLAAGISSVAISWYSGLGRDGWLSPTNISPNTFTKVSTTKVDFNGNALANTLAPACWTAADFANSANQSKKLAIGTTDTTQTPPMTEGVTKPVKVAKAQFILYFWDPAAGQSSTTGVEVMNIDTIVVKHMPKVKYIPRYQISLNMQALRQARATTKNLTQINASAKWLRDQIVARDPLYFRFYDSTGAIKQVEGIIQGNNADAFALAKGKTRVFPNRVDFSILSMVEEP